MSHPFQQLFSDILLEGTGLFLRAHLKSKQQLLLLSLCTVTDVAENRGNEWVDHIIVNVKALTSPNIASKKTASTHKSSLSLSVGIVLAHSADAQSIFAGWLNTFVYFFFVIFQLDHFLQCALYPRWGRPLLLNVNTQGFPAKTRHCDDVIKVIRLFVSGFNVVAAGACGKLPYSYCNLTTSPEAVHL